MADRQIKKLNNIFFYGVSFVTYDSVDVTRDIITNIRKRFLITKKSAANKLYRTSDGENFVYVYNFTLGKPLQWRVLKNKRTIEDIDYLASGKYCINDYDEQGRDIKKVFFDSKHRWFKTNYYNSTSDENLVCSLVPKEFDEGTSILLYNTGEVYPVRLFSCSIPSCDIVRERVISKIPTPQVTALTDRGIVYFMSEADKENYEYILSEQEAVFEKENAPQVFISQKDADSGFNLSVRDFDMSKNLNRTFDISLAKDFSEDFADTNNSLINNDVVNTTQDVVFDDSNEEPEFKIEDDGSVDAAISDMVMQINARTSLDIDASDILNISLDDDAADAVDSNQINDSGIDDQLRHINSVLDGSSVLTAERKLIIGDAVVNDDYISSIIDGIISSAFSSDIEENEELAVVETVTNLETLEVETKDSNTSTIDEINTEVDMISANGDIETDDIVTNVEENEAEPEIETHQETDITEVDEIQEETQDISEVDITASDDTLTEYEVVNTIASAEDYIKENPADIIIESRGETYSYYGESDESGKRSGRGRTFMSDGSIAYEGEYKDDKRSGLGSFYFKDGTLCYWGNWNDNVRSGFGVGISSDDKAVHAGSWDNNKPVGVGIRFDKDGSFKFLSSNCEDKKKGFTICDFTENSFTVRVWSEADDAFIQREISLGDIIK